jgi:hypothetical protein
MALLCITLGWEKDISEADAQEAVSACKSALAVSADDPRVELFTEDSKRKICIDFKPPVQTSHQSCQTEKSTCNAASMLSFESSPDPRKDHLMSRETDSNVIRVIPKGWMAWKDVNGHEHWPARTNDGSRSRKDRVEVSREPEFSTTCSLGTFRRLGYSILRPEPVSSDWKGAVSLPSDTGHAADRSQEDIQTPGSQV